MKIKITLKIDKSSNNNYIKTIRIIIINKMEKLIFTIQYNLVKHFQIFSRIFLILIKLARFQFHLNQTKISKFAQV